MEDRLNGIFNIQDYGADPTGKISASAAIQAAIDAAAAYNDGQGGVVLVPPGTYLCSDIHLKREVRMIGMGTWGYRTTGDCVLQLEDKQDAICVLDLSLAYSATVENLVLQGRGESPDASMTHGFYLSHPDIGRAGGQKEENIPTLRHCKAEDFSGDGIHYDNVWCFRITGCQVRKCRNGLYLKGVDGFILDNWFSRNREWGIYCDGLSSANSAVMVTACRVEWNGQGGFHLDSAGKWQIANCNFDKNFGPALECVSCGNRRCPTSFGITATGNIFNRCGYTPEEARSAHVLLDNVFDVCLTGNVFLAGADDDHTGPVYPVYSVIAHGLKNTVITQNVMQNSCTKRQLLDRGEHYTPQSAEDENAGLVWQNNFGAPASAACYAYGKYFMPSKD